MKYQIILTISALQIFINSVVSLQCYVCDEQDGNTDKCLTTIKTCEYEEDRCLSEIRWSTTPYWTEGAIKQYYISKRCSTEQECVNKERDYLPLCHYIWYEDWKCAECCQGNRCNYYVTLGSSSVSSSMLVLAAALLTTLALRT